ncbi:cyclic nucleotide-binding domain-containing protein [Brachyspira murdochii]|uniref:Putative transcriptional regulator, Crp/Fnr family n=1 Tax=Brachyspira murdochii (strain ATCC 51284 / DSM 12563 / 56-150) TaxID=526224 RepID=D5U7P2_BRAM5|nr:cyclic nucleotide-binding domain-containing protein [Brachyspira murdochii]ADG72838.1 putative transcriptional regulator, Crp/Fnr family [Brachyspira murdochii DSM 12563]
MDKYKLVKYTKGTVIFRNGEEAKDYFYIISRGKILSCNTFCDNFTIKYNEGGIIGIIQSVTGEPYYSTSETAEDCELWQIKTENINRLNNKHLINKISNYLSFILERWLSKYYSIITKNKIDLYNKDDILTMASIYKEGGFIDASYKLCKAYLNSFKENINIDKVNNFIKSLTPAKKPEYIKKNLLKITKGYCLYSELEISNYIYYIKSGKLGVYNIINGKYITRAVYTSGYIINGYSPVLEYKPLLTTVIALEDSVIEIINQDELIKNLYSNAELRIKFIKMISIKIISTVLKIKAVKKENIRHKFILIIYSILKIETLFSMPEYLKLLYKIDDIKNMLNLDIENEIIYSELKKIKYIELDSLNSIIVIDIVNYFKEYEDYTK